MSLFVDDGFGMFDSFHAPTGIEIDDETLVAVLHAVVIIITIERELTGVFVFFRGVGVEKRERLFHMVNTKIIHSVVPTRMAGFHKLAFLAFIPNGTCGFINPDNVDVIMECATLVAKNHIVGLVKQLSGLL